MGAAEKKLKQDRQDYETLCRLAGEYGVPASVDWYWHFNELKKKLIRLNQYSIYDNLFKNT